MGSLALISFSVWHSDLREHMSSAKYRIQTEHTESVYSLYGVQLTVNHKNYYLHRCRSWAVVSVVVTLSEDPLLTSKKIDK